MGLDNLVYPYTIDTSKRDTDFTGFSFNGFHSTDLGLVRVSSSDRYEDTFGPQFTDKTVQAPAANRTYYFGTDYTQKPFTLNVAFDSLTEEGLRALRQIFNAKSVGPLIFDEWPYKVYSAKVQSPPQFKYICFDLDKPMEVLVPKEEVFRVDNTTTYFSLQEIPVDWKNNLVLTRVRGNYPTNTALEKIMDSIRDGRLIDKTINFQQVKFGGAGYVKVSYYYRTITRRIYKGEGTIQFVCYYPFAHSRYKFLNQYVNRGIGYNLDEWKKASGLLSAYNDYNIDKNILKRIGTIINSDGTSFTPVSGSGPSSLKYGTGESAKNAITDPKANVVVYLYNPGDLETDCRLYLWIAGAEWSRPHGIRKIELRKRAASSEPNLDKDTLLASLGFESTFATESMTGFTEGDVYLCIDSAKNLIYGCDDRYSPTGTLYNQCIQTGNFFKIPMTTTDTVTDTRIETRSTEKIDNEYKIRLENKPLEINSIRRGTEIINPEEYDVDFVDGIITFKNDSSVKSYTIEYEYFFSTRYSEYYLFIDSNGWGRGLYNLSQDNDAADGNEIDKDTYYYLYY